MEKGKPINPKALFAVETLQVIRMGLSIILKAKTFQPRIISPLKLFFKRDLRKGSRKTRTSQTPKLQKLRNRITAEKKTKTK